MACPELELAKGPMGPLGPEGPLWLRDGIAGPVGPLRVEGVVVAGRLVVVEVVVEEVGKPERVAGKRLGPVEEVVGRTAGRRTAGLPG